MPGYRLLNLRLVCRDLPRCPRCGAGLQYRFPDSQICAWTLLIAAVLLYIPANLLPVMATCLLGQSNESTIIAGVIDFWQAGSRGIALVIFLASVVILCTKFLALVLLLIASQRRSTSQMRERAMEGLGLDVVVVAVVSALVQFPSLSLAAAFYFSVWWSF